MQYYRHHILQQFEVAYGLSVIPIARVAQGLQRAVDSRLPMWVFPEVI